VERPPAWAAVAARLGTELGEPVRHVEALGRPRPGRAVWAAEAQGLGALVVKARHGDRAGEKTRWCAEHLPLLRARGYPAPEIVWHGFLEAGWHVAVQRRLPGTPLRSLEPPLLEALLELVELQADAGVDPVVRDFAAYQAYVLFDGWDHVWRDAETASLEARRLCVRLRRWLRPVHGRRLDARDFAHNDLNLTNVLVEGTTITGVVDWDEFGLNSRAVDLTALAFDCTRLGSDAAAEKLLRRIVELDGEDGLRCAVGYRLLSHVAARARRRDPEGVCESVGAAERLLDTLDAR
jgi:Phosphotransferase enzyme family